ncbi:unnamed protein product [Diamesa serratosioi]
MNQFVWLFVVSFVGFVSCENARIVGGEKAPEHYPYQISLQMERSGGGPGFFLFPQASPASNWSHFCGGSVLNENFIVTAAHCIQGFTIEKMSVLAGTPDLKDEARGTRHLVDNCVVHPEYVELNNSDVAVCRLKSPFIYGKNIAPIELDKTYHGGDEICTLTGWGYTTMVRGFPLPTDLQRAMLPTITNKECNERGHSVGPREVCTFSRFGQGACNGDSGGPLYCNGKLAGVTSYGTVICAFGKPDVFTRVSKFVDWIIINTILGAVSVSSIASTLGANFTNNIFG